MLYSKDLTVSMCHFSLTFLIHIGCICLTFLHCAFSKFSSNCLTEKIHSHIGCIRLAFLHCAFSNVSSNCLPGKMHSHIDCICLTFLRCAFSNVSPKRLHKRMQNHICCICMVFLHWFVLLRMSPQRTWSRAGKVTLATVVWLFAAVCFQMCL